jgi:hypothetical protein
MNIKVARIVHYILGLKLKKKLGWRSGSSGKNASLASMRPWVQTVVLPPPKKSKGKKLNKTCSNIQYILSYAWKQNGNKNFPDVMLQTVQILKWACFKQNGLSYVYRRQAELRT